jgi:uncharacterized protein (DUF362 family)
LAESSFLSGLFMKRRIFIKSGIGALLASCLPFRLFPAAGNAVAVYEITGDPALAVSDLFSVMGGIRNLIGSDLSTASVLIKPNLCLPHKDSNGTITSVTLIRALCEYLIGEGVGRIIIADHTLQTADMFETNEIVTYARGNPRISLMLANEQRYYTPRPVEGKVLKTTESLKILDKVNYFINLATAKHHSATHVSLCIKNLMGVIWDRKVFHTEIDLDQALADLTTAIRPQLNIVDASRVLLNRGPVGPGPLEKPGKIYAGTDMLAVDSVVTSSFNFGGKSLSAKEVAHLWASYKSGTGEIDLGKIEVVKRIV